MSTAVVVAPPSGHSLSSDFLVTAANTPTAVIVNCPLPAAPTNDEHAALEQLRPLVRARSEESRSRVTEELSSLATHIERVIATHLPQLAESAGYYFRLDGKRLRPQLVLLTARAVADSVMAACSPAEADQHRQRVAVGAAPLAQMVEMIHTASLIHDDVIDNATTRRGAKAINAVFGNRVSILCGDFLLARVSMAMAALQNHQVNVLMSRVLSDLVQGEFLQMGPGRWQTSFEHYLEKTYKKTASLLANGCAAAAVLADGDESLTRAAESYGRHLGLAFQIIDDLLDIVSSEAELGKEPCVDLKLGLATAPVLFAAEEHSELRAMIERRFAQAGDVERASLLVQQSRGIERTRQLAEAHILQALEALTPLCPSPAKDALICIAVESLHRRK